MRKLLLAAVAAIAMPSAGQAATYIWSGGNYVPGTTSPNPLLSPDVLQLTGAANKFFNGGTFTNQSGTVDWQGAGGIYLQNGASVSNAGTWTTSVGSVLTYNGGAAVSFLNTGVFRKTGGTDTTIGAINFTNSGTINAQTGRIVFAGGDAVFNAGSAFTGAGTTAITSDAAFNGAFTTANLDFEGGTYTGSAAVLNGSADWLAGSFRGGWTISSGATVTASSATNKFIDNGTVTNNGAIAWTGTGGLYLQNGANLVNNGAIGFTGSMPIAYNGGAATLFTNNASGVITVSGGATVNLSNAFVNNGGTLTANGRLAYTGGDATFNAGTVFNGTGVNAIASDAVFNGSFTTTNLDFEGGTYTGSTAVLNGNADWLAGNFRGGWTIAGGATLAASGPTNKFIDNGTVTNNGTIAWTGTGGLYFQNGANLVNNGAIGFTGSMPVAYNGGAATLFTNNASGVITVGGGATVNLSNPFVNNGGTLTANGRLAYNGSAATFNAGTVFNGTGVNAISSDAAFNGSFTTTNLDFEGGTYTGSAAVLNGSADWLAGDFRGGWTIASGATLAASGASNKFFDATNFTNNGTLAWGGTGGLYLENGAVVTNNGRIAATTNSGIFYNGGAAVTLVNNGVIEKTAGTGTTTIGDNMGFDNNGTISALSGNIALPTNFVNDGTLAGTAAFSVLGTLTNNGTIAPGGALGAGVGTLALTGNYAQGGGGLFSVGFGPGGTVDLFNISGTAALNGALGLNCLGCTVNAGDVFTVLDSVGNLTGTFASSTATGFNAGFLYSIIYDTQLDRVQIRIDNAGTPTPNGAVPEPATWAMMLLGFGAMGGMLRGRRRQMPRIRYA